MGEQRQRHTHVKPQKSLYSIIYLMAVNNP